MDNATVQGLVANVSPMKKGQWAMYFDPKFTDERDQIRAVWFSSALHTRIACLVERNEPVTFEIFKRKLFRPTRNNDKSEYQDLYITKEI